MVNDIYAPAAYWIARNKGYHSSKIQASLRLTQFMKISQNDEATYWLYRKGSVAKDCDNDRTHLC